MKISKTRLLEIIREEVELHEKNTFELDESELEELTDKEGNKILRRAIKNTEGGSPEEQELEESGVEEDALYSHEKVEDPETGKMVHPEIEPPKKRGKIISVNLR